jgi:diguanylate cyclase (GGDEF)-like protein
MDQAMAVAERLRSSVQNTTIASPHGLLSVSVSIGVAEHSSNHSNLSEVLAISDAALYKAKAAGRNRIVAGGIEEYLALHSANATDQSLEAAGIENRNP